jgi:hypothetical protein
MTDQALFYRILLNLVSGEHRALIETAGDIRACMTVADRVHVYCGKDSQRLIVLKNCFCGRLLGCVSVWH